MDAEVVEKLKELGASEFDHVNGTLLAHLQGTHDLLEKWGNRGALCNAGLYHAVYGTAGFQQNLIGLQDRSAVADLIGKESENIVYLFSACDRDYVYGQMLASDGFDQVTKVEYRDRFSQATYPLDPGAFADLCELTMANELEIARWRTGEFLRQHCGYLKDILAKMAPHVSTRGIEEFERVFDDTR